MPPRKEPAGRLVLITCADEAEASRIQEALVGEKLAACVTAVPGAVSRYRWRGRVETAREVLLLAKTTAARFPALRRRTVQLHSYDVPEIIALPIRSGHRPYLEWIGRNTAPGP